MAPSPGYKKREVIIQERDEALAEVERLQKLLLQQDDFVQLKPVIKQASEDYDAMCKQVRDLQETVEEQQSFIHLYESQLERTTRLLDTKFGMKKFLYTRNDMRELDVYDIIFTLGDEVRGLLGITDDIEYHTDTLIQKKQELEQEVIRLRDLEEELARTLGDMVAQKNEIQSLAEDIEFKDLIIEDMNQELDDLKAQVKSYEEVSGVNLVQMVLAFCSDPFQICILENTPTISYILFEHGWIALLSIQENALYVNLY